MLDAHVEAFRELTSVRPPAPLIATADKGQPMDYVGSTPEREVLTPPILRVAQRDLTRKEIECLKWCKEGKTNWEIGEILIISEKTVEFHLRNAMRKLGATNRITAVVAGIKTGLIAL